MDRATKAEDSLELALELLENADSLLGDAEVLSQAGRPARAVALALVAAEELGKIYLCLGGMTGEHEVPSVTSREWRSHRDKLETARALELMLLDADPQFDSAAIRAEIEEQMRIKMAALYVDHRDGRPESPSTLGVDPRPFIERGRASSSVLHGVLDRVTPEVLSAMDLHGAQMARLVEALMDEEDPAATVARVRSVTTAAAAEDGEALMRALTSALGRGLNPTPRIDH